MKCGSLFSGIGGLDLGLERAGMEIIWQSEIDPYASRVLKKHWPDVPNLGDVTQIDWREVERPDVVCGGFPCQPISLAGKRGVTEDSRWLWPYFAEAVRLLRPRFVLVENVPGLLLPWRDKRGFWNPAPVEELLRDLDSCGYDSEWDCIPAAAVGAPHIRDRVFLLAYPHGERPLHSQSEGFTTEAGVSTFSHVGSSGADGFLRRQARELPHPHTNGGRLEAIPQRNGQSAGGSATQPRRDVDGLRSDVPHPAGAGLEGRLQSEGPREALTVFAGRGGVEGRSWPSESRLGRVADGVPDWVDRIKCVGNAVVPQVAEWIGRRLMDAA